MLSGCDGRGFMCLVRAAGMYPASPDVIGRKSLVQIKYQAPKMQGKEKSWAPGQMSPDQGQRHSYLLGITSLTLHQAALSIPLGGTAVAQKLFHQAQSQLQGDPWPGPGRRIAVLFTR